LNTSEHVDSENIKLKIGHGSSAYQIFYFFVFQVVEHTADSFRMITFKNKTKNPNNSIFWPFFPILATIYVVKITFWKKVGRRSSHDLFSIWYFLNLPALGYSKPVTVFLYLFESTRPSAWIHDVNVAITFLLIKWH
jgi:hypothetical protein